MNDEVNNWFEVPGRATAVSQALLPWNLSGIWRLMQPSVCLCVCVCPLQAQVRLCVTGERWSHFDEGELAVLWLAGATVVRGGGFSHSGQMSLFNQPLLNRMWRGENKSETRTLARFPKIKSSFSEQRWRVMIWKSLCANCRPFGATPQHTEMC